MTEKLEKEVDKGKIKITYLAKIDSRDKNLPRSIGNCDYVPKLNPSMSLTYYKVIV